MTTLVHCVYASKATTLFHEYELPALLEQARVANAARGVTGMLLYVEGNFFQALEGEASTVATLFERIGSDPRHKRVKQILCEPIADRMFADWTLGFSSIEFRDVQGHVGESDFIASATCLERLSAARARKLLNAFRAGGWRKDRTDVQRPREHRV